MIFQITHRTVSTSNLTVIAIEAPYSCFILVCNVFPSYEKFHLHLNVIHITHEYLSPAKCSDGYERCVK